MNTRKEKLNFLKGLIMGNRNLNELSERSGFESFYQMNSDLQEKGLFTGGPADMERVNGYVTREQIDEFCKQHPKVEVVVFVVQDGNDPIPGEEDRLNNEL